MTYHPPTPTPAGYECLVTYTGKVWHHVRRSGQLWYSIATGKPFHENATPFAFAPLPGHEWRRLEEATCVGSEGVVRLLVENVSHDDKPRLVVDASLMVNGDWWDVAEGEPLESHLCPLAWKPADSTELPAELEGK